jgi:neutral trehalase
MDEPTRTVVLHRTEPTRLQSMLLQVADKVSNVQHRYLLLMIMRLMANFNLTVAEMIKNR